MADAQPETLVDLSYRGVVLAQKVALVQIEPSSGYLELFAPMPVGTSLELIAQDGTVFSATVTRIHEAVGNTEQQAGMKVAPQLEVAAARQWWQARLQAAPLRASSPVLSAPVVPAAVQAARATVRLPAMREPDAQRTSGSLPIADPSSGVEPVLIDDGRQTQMMPAMDRATLEAMMCGDAMTADVAAVLDAGESAGDSNDGVPEASAGDTMQGLGKSPGPDKSGSSKRTRKTKRR